MTKTSTIFLRSLAALGLLALSACGDDPAEEPCGNGTIDAGEQCDDGNNNNGDGCNAICFNEAVCGNGTVDAGEQCDDGNTVSGDLCSSTCQNEEPVVDPVCGNGTLEAGEACDDGNTDDGDGCQADCTETPTGFCGDSVVNAGEECDDGNTTSGDGCSATCMTEAFCGDGNVDDGEECDDGNNVDDDGCNADCTLPPAVCGDGVVDAAAGEQCDNGDDNSNTAADACREDCQLASCGDAVVDSGEECDGGDTCQADCTLSPTASCVDPDAIDLATDGTPAAGGFQYVFESAAVTADIANDPSCTRAADSAEVTVVFTPTRPGWYVARTDSPATTADTVLAVNTGDCGNPTLVACSDNQLEGTSSLVTWVAEAGVSYPIVVDTLSGGSVTLQVQSIQPPGVNGSPCPQGLCDPGLECVANTCQLPSGTCGTALEGSDVLTGDFLTGLTGTVSLDGRAAIQTGSCGGAGTEAVIRVVPDAEGELRVTATGNGFPVSTYLRRTCGSSVGELACATDGTASTSVRDGQAYFVIVDSEDTVGGSVQVDIEVAPFSLLGEACGAESPCVEGTLCDATSSLCSLPPALEGEACVPDDVTQACAADLTCADIGGGEGLCVGSVAGTCAEPSVATVAGEVVTVSDDAAVEYDTFCGVSTGTVLAYEMTATATLVVRATRADGLIDDTQVTLRQGCEDAEAQTSCGQSEGAASVAAFDALAGETVYILVGGAAGDVRVSAREVPTALAGEACDLAGLSTRCEQDYFCSDLQVCEPNAGNTCARPKSINEQSTGALLNGTLQATIRTEWPVSLQEGSCGGVGTEGVLSYVAETSGEFTFAITESSVDVSIYTRSVCRDDESESSCGEVATPSVTVDLLDGEEVFLIVDATTSVFAEATIAITVEEEGSLGDRCSGADPCAAGLICDTSLAEPSCVFAPGADGEACSTDEGRLCDTGLSCITDRATGDEACGPVGTLGDECSYTAGCSAGFFCTATFDAPLGLCEEQLGLEDGCEIGQCGEGLTCIQTEDNPPVCRGTGTASGDFCKPQPAANACDPGFECIALLGSEVVGGVCVRAETLELDCESVANCQPGQYCSPTRAICQAEEFDIGEGCFEYGCTSGVCRPSPAGGETGMCEAATPRLGETCLPGGLDECIAGTRCTEVAAGTFECVAN